MDVRLSEGSGIEACAEITAKAPGTRVIMLTVSDEEADLYESVKSGASGYLLKDATIEEVAQAVRLVERARVRSARAWRPAARPVQDDVARRRGEPRAGPASPTVRSKYSGWWPRG